LSLSIDEFDKIKSDGYTKNQIDETLDSIENYKKNSNYKSLNMTCRKWLKREFGEKSKIEGFSWDFDNWVYYQWKHENNDIVFRIESNKQEAFFEDYKINAGWEAVIIKSVKTLDKKRKGWS
jgi:hypothetical protein